MDLESRIGWGKLISRLGRMDDFDGFFSDFLGVVVSTALPLDMRGWKMYLVSIQT